MSLDQYKLTGKGMWILPCWIRYDGSDAQLNKIADKVRAYNGKIIGTNVRRVEFGQEKIFVVAHIPLDDARNFKIHMRRAGYKVDSESMRWVE